MNRSLYFSRINIQSETVELYGREIFNFIRNVQTVLYSGCTVLHSFKRSSCPASLSAFGIICLLILAILIGVPQYLIVV